MLSLFYYIVGHWFVFVAIFVAVIVPLSMVARLLLLILTAVEVRRIAQHGVGSVSWLGWAIMVLTVLSFLPRRSPVQQAPYAPHLWQSAALGTVGGAVAGAFVNGLTGNAAPLTARRHNGNRIS